MDKQSLYHFLPLLLQVLPKAVGHGRQKLIQRFEINDQVVAVSAWESQRPAKDSHGGSPDMWVYLEAEDKDIANRNVIANGQLCGSSVTTMPLAAGEIKKNSAENTVVLARSFQVRRSGVDTSGQHEADGSMSTTSSTTIMTSTVRPHQTAITFSDTREPRVNEEPMSEQPADPLTTRQTLEDVYTFDVLHEHVWAESHLLVDIDNDNRPASKRTQKRGFAIWASFHAGSPSSYGSRYPALNSSQDWTPRQRDG
ncbi:hypothetical protein E6O75_ATG11294 [Venturia nashicola]|uniref:Uncharacterized protein n=1 Tax=Venturia nashicola TaxID=86259 RepID=A0A4Z1NKX6_9PEZI|nr:hypothetical protein E6O75_ATG11294 [Venturia nashicola]